MAQRNIAAYLPDMARRHPYMAGVVFPEGRDRSGRVAYTHLTFKQLDEQSDRLAAGLEAFGIGRGIRTTLMVKPSLAFFSLTFALFKVGAVPVLIDPGMGLKNLAQCLREAEAEAFIGIPKAHIARLLLRWPAMKKLVTVGGKGPWGGVTLQALRKMGEGRRFTMPMMRDEDDAAILFTSGSTGVPKGAIYSHGIFQGQVAALRTEYDIQLGEVDLATFPLFALFAPALGMTAIIPDMDATRPASVNPTKIIEACDNFGVTNMFGSPALLNRVGRYGASKGIRLESLKRVISAGAPVHEKILRTFSQMLPEGAQIYTPYGATESLPVCSIGSSEILGETAAMTSTGAGVCVGRPVGDIQLVVIPVDDAPIESYTPEMNLPANQVGEIAVRGPVVTRAYFNREASTQLAKMRDVSDGGIWHRMGDLGYRDETGRVWFCGRKAHRVETEQGPMFTIPVEGIFNSHEDVFRSALVGIGQPGAQRPVVCVELEKGCGRDKGQIVTELLALAKRFETTRRIDRILFHESFPVDIRHNAKIFREKLAVWAASQL